MAFFFRRQQKNKVDIKGTDVYTFVFVKKIRRYKKKGTVIYFSAKNYIEIPIKIQKLQSEFPVKRSYKAKRFLRWATKLLVPDFLIGHPNLWDNLKTLRKHPHFKPLRMALVAWLLFSITSGGVGIYSIQQAVRVSADTLADDTQAEFDAGTYSDTQFDAGNSWVELDATGLTNGSGNYTSSVKDAGGSSSWDTIAWVPERPTGKELPDSAASETAYNSG
ncbi:MAG: hypothetical protein Q8Q23_00010, partial [bacterium]|nr:hypothetical protein [bacterium]